MPVVFIPAQLRKLTGGATQVELDAGTVREVIDQLEKRFPGTGARLRSGDSLANGLAVAIDGNVASQGLRAHVSDHGEVHFLPAIGGG